MLARRAVRSKRLPRHRSAASPSSWAASAAVGGSGSVAAGDGGSASCALPVGQVGLRVPVLVDLGLEYGDEVVPQRQRTPATGRGATST
jgi:hypothetical protein